MRIIACSRNICCGMWACIITKHVYIIYTYIYVYPSPMKINRSVTNGLRCFVPIFFCTNCVLLRIKGTTQTTLSFSLSAFDVTLMRSGATCAHHHRQHCNTHAPHSIHTCWYVSFVLNAHAAAQSKS